MSSISFFCAVCGQALAAEPSFAGKVLECIRCERSVPVPGFPATPRDSGCAAVYPPEILSMEMVFRCSSCNAKVAVDARLEGRNLDCPQCRKPVSAPLWSSLATAPEGAGSLKKGRPTLTPAEIEFLSGDLKDSPGG